MLARVTPLLADPDRMRGIGHAALDVLCAEERSDPSRVAAIGYGTGGAIALELGRDGAELRAIGTINAMTTGRPGEAAHIRCPVWAGVGSEDPIMPAEQRDAFANEMQAAGVDWRIVVSPPTPTLVLGALGILSWLGTIWAASTRKPWARWVATALFASATTCRGSFPANAVTRSPSGC